MRRGLVLSQNPDWGKQKSLRRLYTMYISGQSGSTVVFKPNECVDVIGKS